MSEVIDPPTKRKGKQAMKKPSKIEDVRETGGARLTYVCPFCGKETVIELTQDECLDLFSGLAARSYVQDIFPNKDATFRELMVSGMCYECQAEFFKEDPEEDEEE